MTILNMGILQIIILCVVIILIFITIIVYNNLIGKKNGVEKSYKNIDTLLLKRYDLMNNLILQAERAMEHEETIHLELAAMRQNIQQVDKEHADIASLHKALDSSQARFNLLVEQYPQLRGVDAVLTGMQTNIKLENEIAAGRIQYNDNVELYRNAIELFPNNLFANFFGFHTAKYTYIEVDAAHKQPVIPFYADRIKKGVRN